MELILVGDMHATPAELPECERHLPLWRQVQSEHPLAKFVFLGDQTDKNDALSVRVMEFWRSVGAEFSPVFVVGNHDQVYAGSSHNSMNACRDVGTVVSDSRRLGAILFVAYCRDSDQFLARCDGGGALICHQDLAGASYDNGRRSLSSMSPPGHFVQVVSGHLHVPQEFGRIWYPGSPRWRGLKDASVERRAIWWADFSDSGLIVGRRPYWVDEVADRVKVVRDVEGGLAPPVDQHSVVDVVGSRQYIERRRRELRAIGARVRGLPVAATPPKVRESDGLRESMAAHLEQFCPPSGTSKEWIKAAIKDRMGVDV